VLLPEADPGIIDALASILLLFLESDATLVQDGLVKEEISYHTCGSLL
jgi:hypothetical protein